MAMAMAMTMATAVAAAAVSIKEEEELPWLIEFITFCFGRIENYDDIEHGKIK